MKPITGVLFYQRSRCYRRISEGMWTYECAKGDRQIREKHLPKWVKNGLAVLNLAEDSAPIHGVGSVLMVGSVRHYLVYDPVVGYLRKLRDSQYRRKG